MLRGRFGKKSLRQPLRHAAALFAFLMIFSCKERTFNFSEDVDIAPVGVVSYDREEMLRKHRFDRITPSGENIFAAALRWAAEQESQANQFARPEQSANNISRVLEMAGINSYSSPLLSDVIGQVRARGGWIIPLPRDARSSAQIIESYFAGSVPVGTLVSGCLNPDCSGGASSFHMGVVADVDSNDHLQLMHNNWHRPENRPWRPHMIPLAWFRQGFSSKWMATPWIARTRNEQGSLTSFSAAISEIPIFDPANSSVTLVVIPEILAEIKNSQAVVTDGAGAVMPLRSSRANSQATPPADLVRFAECKKLKMISAVPANLRDAPKGGVVCKIALGTQVERVNAAGSWTQVRGVCTDGRPESGFVLSSLTIPSC
ncbi:MAG: hypothetical protein RL189_268 [Pseudomonadota bacterium]